MAGTEHLGSEVVLGVVALCIMVGPMLATRLRLPAMLGLVIAGTMMGPYVLNVISDAHLEGLGNIGLLYLMFQAGLELDLITFNKNRNAAVIFGLMTFSLPLALGFGAGAYVGLTGAAAVLIGSIWASHTLVTHPEVKEAGIVSNRAVTATAGATVITDTLALLVLAVVSSISGGGSVGAVVAGLAIGLGLLVVYAMVVLPWLGRRFFMGSGQSRTNRFVFLLFGFSSAAMIGAVFGIEGLVGAFLAGLGLNRLVPSGGELIERVEFFGAALLVPAFLIYVGTKLDPGVVAQMETVGIALTFLAALVVGKALAAFLSGRLLRFSLAESGVMFGMSIPQAAATLAATLVGASIGLFTDRIVNAVVLVVLISLLLGALLTRYFARRVPVAEKEQAILGREVLVAMRDDELAPRLARLGALVASPDAGLVVPVAIASHADQDVDAARRVLASAVKAATAEGADVEGRVRRAPSFATAARDSVIEEDASALVLAWREVGLEERIFGTELDRIGRQVETPILAARLDTAPISRIVAVLDVKPRAGSRIMDARLALDVAQRVARGDGIPLRVVLSSRSNAQALGIDEERESVEIVIVDGEFSAASCGLRSGDLLVITPARYRSGLGSRATREIDGLSMLIVAGPGRMRVTGSPALSTTLLGVEAPAS